MNVPSILARLDAERRALVRDGERIQLLPHATRLQAADGSHHCIIFSSLTESNCQSIIRSEIDYHRRLNSPFEWKLYSHDTPAHLLQLLQQHGFTVGPAETVLVYDLSTRRSFAQADNVVRVDTIDQVNTYRQVAEEIFGKDYSFTAKELADAIAIGSTQHRGYIAYAGDKPVCIGRLLAHPQSHFGGLYGGGTLPNFRGRGFYRAIIAARAKDAVVLGARYLIVDALPTSRPILERLGFEVVAQSWPCQWSP